MPSYVFKCQCGKRKEVVRSMKDVSIPVFCSCRKKMKRDYAAEHGHVIDTPGNWPMESIAAGVSPDQVPEFVQFDKQKGVPTQYSRDGNPIFRDRKHRRDYLRAHGIFDRNAGYGDPAPVNR